MSVPVVPLSAFTNLAGSALVDDLRRLLASPDFTGLVLFSDTLGEHLAILPVGPGQNYRQIADTHGIEIEGLRPLCGLQLQAERPAARERAPAQDPDLQQLAETLKTRERYIAECEKRLTDLGQNLSEREAMLEQRELMLIAKERDFFRRSGDYSRNQEAAGLRHGAEKQG